MFKKNNKIWKLTKRIPCIPNTCDTLQKKKSYFNKIFIKNISNFKIFGVYYAISNFNVYYNIKFLMILNCNLFYLCVSFLNSYVR